MTIRFHRSRELELILSDPGAAGRRGSFFDVSLGVSAPVDPLSGMTVNLMLVEKWLDVLSREAHDVFDFLEKSWRAIEPLALAQGARLERVEARAGLRAWARSGDGWEEIAARDVESAGADGVRRVSRRTLVRRQDLAQKNEWRLVATRHQRGRDGAVVSEI